MNDTWFDTLTVRGAGPGRRALRARAVERRINLRRVDGDTVGAVLRRDDDARRCSTDLVEVFGVAAAVGRRSAATSPGLPDAERRTSEFLTHPVFHEHRSETEMLRYLRRLADMDVALDRAMIPLGSCTMKLNATTEMEPVTWPEFGGIHPFAPLDQVEGYLELIHDLEATLARDHRLRRRVAAAQRRVAGRAGRPARHPRLPPQPGRRASATCA